MNTNVFLLFKQQALTFCTLWVDEGEVLGILEGSGEDKCHSHEFSNLSYKGRMKQNVVKISIILNRFLNYKIILKCVLKKALTKQLKQKWHSR